MGKELKNKPLVEAILEVRWQLQGGPPGLQVDPHYKLLLGRLFDRMREDYPAHEQLQTATLPDEMAGHVVQHRFRVAAESWPLVQVGPGIFTVNSTADYTWLDFRTRVLAAIGRLYDAHPKVEELKISKLILRYIDAVEFDYGKDSLFEFLKDKLKLSISLPNNLFDGTGVENKPTSFTWQSSFKCERPRGKTTVRFATGQKKNKPAVVWETTVETVKDGLPEMPKGFEVWLDGANVITEDWFFKMIAGELERRFSGE